jgi:hypothetical protein
MLKAVKEMAMALSTSEAAPRLEAKASLAERLSKSSARRTTLNTTDKE